MRRVLMALAMLIIGQGCTYEPPPRYPQRVMGRLVSQGGDLGSFVFVPTRCVARGAWVDAVADGSSIGVVRVQGELRRQSDGAAFPSLTVRIARRDGPAGPIEVALDEQTCEVLAGYSLPSAGDAGVAVRCSTPGGGTLEGHLVLQGCS